jgi:CRISPR/Cas system-associated exonuclease Cas4 (RecB family)
MLLEHLSHSRMNLFEECELKYKFKYHEKIKLDEPEPIYFLYGKIIHKFAEEFVKEKGKRSATSIIQDILQGTMPLERKEGGDYGRPKLPPEYASRIPIEVNNVCKIIKKLGFEGDVEWPFNYDLDPPNGKNIVGFIDRLIPLHDGKKFVIVDYKTTKAGPWRKNQQSIKYDMQLKIYARIVQKHFNISGENIAACLHYVMDNSTVGVSNFNDNDLERTEKILLDAYNQIEEIKPEQARPNIGQHCYRCEFKKLCSPYKNSKLNSKW